METRSNEEVPRTRSDEEVPRTRSDEEVPRTRSDEEVPRTRSDEEVPRTRRYEEVRRIHLGCFDPQYDDWAPDYEQDISVLQYQGHVHAVSLLIKHFRGDAAQARVLDVACGSGLVAKQMSHLGFRRFVGVDASEGMLREAALTQLYEDLHLRTLGQQPLSVGEEEFDVVTVVAGLYPGFIPVSAVREFWDATKPGGLVCFCRGTYLLPEYVSYDRQLEKELRSLEAGGLCTRVVEENIPQYILNSQKEDQDPENLDFIPGTIHVFRKSAKNGTAIM